MSGENDVTTCPTCFVQRHFSIAICPTCKAAAPVSAPTNTNRHGERCSEECGQGRHQDCTETFETCNCTYRGLHKTPHAYATIPMAPTNEVSAAEVKKCGKCGLPCVPNSNYCEEHEFDDSYCELCHHSPHSPNCQLADHLSAMKELQDKIDKLEAELRPMALEKMAAERAHDRAELSLSTYKTSLPERAKIAWGRLRQNGLCPDVITIEKLCDDAKKAEAIILAEMQREIK